MEDLKIKELINKVKKLELSEKKNILNILKSN